MAEFIDLTGLKFGMLYAESKEPTQKDRKTRWLCKCECGNTCVVTSYELRKGKIKSCGCGRKKDITGLRFGKLTAIERTEQYVIAGGRKKFLWKCVCDCGETVYRLPEKLRDYKNHACNKCVKEYAVSEMVKGAGFVAGSELSKISSNKPNAQNTSGVKGVFFNNRTEKWRAMLKFQGVSHYLGEYKDLDSAIKARKAGEEKYFQPFLEEHSDFFNKTKTAI